MNEPVFDLHTLQMVQQVAQDRSFSKAAIIVGLSQSALSRKIGNLETKLGFKLFERTTRKVTPTEAGAIFIRETGTIPNLLQGAIQRVREECLQETPRIRVGLSNELGLAHIPGIFRQNYTGAKIIVSQLSHEALMAELQNAELDLGIFTRPEKLPTSLSITHQITDDFVAIAPSSQTVTTSFDDWSQSQAWLLPPAKSPLRALVGSHHPMLQSFM